MPTVQVNLLNIEELNELADDLNEVIRNFEHYTGKNSVSDSLRYQALKLGWQAIISIRRQREYPKYYDSHGHSTN